ncbi:MAG: cytochrome c biogenesis protein ResB [Desulfurella sp.]
MRLNKIFVFLKSLNLTIFLLVCIALMVAISSFQSIYPAFLKSIGLYNIYYSSYFKFVIILFIINLVSCNISLIPKTKKLFEPPIKAQKSFRFNDVEDKKKQLKLLLKRKKLLFYEKNNVILVHKYPIRKFAVYFIHLSILIIAIGALITNFFGFRGILVLKKDKPTNTVYFVNSSTTTLPFSIESKNFTIKYYKKGSVPKEYKTTGLILDNSKKIPFNIYVNHPFKYHGIWFYQSSYMPEKSKTFISIKVNNRTNKLYINKPEKIGNMVLYLKDLQYYNSKFVANLYVFTPKGYANGWLFENQSVNVAGTNISFLNVYETFISLISASKDPGSPIILSGFILLGLSSFLVLLPYKRKTYSVLKK